MLLAIFQEGPYDLHNGTALVCGPGYYLPDALLYLVTCETCTVSHISLVCIKHWSQGTTWLSQSCPAVSKCRFNHVPRYRFSYESTCVTLGAEDTYVYSAHT